MRFGIAPFVDGSCRREPDLDSVWPAITALCRASLFAPRLQVGDRIAYVTKRGIYGGDWPRHWRLTALLQVAYRFEMHAAAAVWYTQQRLPLPKNCMVPGNPPAPLDHTDHILSPEIRSRTAGMSPGQTVRVWDANYFARAKQHNLMLVCKSLFLELTQPPRITKEDWIAWNGRVPSTLNPPRISEALWHRLQARALEAPR